MVKAKQVTMAALMFAIGGGTVYLSTDGGETLEQIALAHAPITDALLLTAPEACLDEIQATGDDPSCSLVVAWYPRYPPGSKTVFPETLVYDEAGEVVPPGLKEMRLLNLEKREVWRCGSAGAVMPARVQDCLDTLHEEAEK